MTAAHKFPKPTVSFDLTTSGVTEIAAAVVAAAATHPPAP
jgi:hypothetical protein